MSILLLSTLFLILGVFVLYLFLSSFWGALAELFPRINVKAFLQKRLLSQLSQDLEKIDAAIDARNIPVAQTLILQSLKLDSPPSGNYHYETIVQHNFVLLSKSVHLLDACNTRSNNLTLLEKEFQSRASLLKLYSDAMGARQKISRKDSSAESKKWALQEMEGKIASIVTELKQNADSIIKEMKILLASAAAGKGGVKYH